MSNTVREIVIDDSNDLVISTRPKLPPRDQLYIDGIEVTQAIQYYQSSKHLTDPADQGFDNSVRMIANRPAWVRVYIRGFFSTRITLVTGTLEVQRWNRGFPSQTYGPFLPLSPGHVITRLHIPYAVERGNLGTTLNFVIPADYMLGHLLLKLNITGASLSSYREVYLNVTRQQTLKLSGIMIGYDGPNGNPTNPTNIQLAAPTLADLQATSLFAIKTLPVQTYAAYRIAGTFTWNSPLNDPRIGGPNSGNCSQNWINLNNAVAQARTNDGNRPDQIYYGLIPAGVPVNVSGCNSSGISSGRNRDQISMAHEIGHYLGLSHAPCGPVGFADPNYPAYEPYDPPNMPNASIGEYGLDITDGTIFSPQTFKDYMSYCWPVWISLYNYQKHINNPLLDPTTVGEDFPWWQYYILDPKYIPEEWVPDPLPMDHMLATVKMKPEPLISLIGIIHNEKVIDVQNVSRVLAFRNLTNVKKTQFSAELLDDAGHVLSTGAVYSLPSCGCNECRTQDQTPEPPYPFQAFLSDVAPGAALRIRYKKDEIWVRHAPRSPPTIEGLKAKLVQNFLDITWSSKSFTERDPESWIQYSKDKGKTWEGLAIGVRGNNVKIDISTLPPGPVRLRLLINDGYYTTTSKPVQVNIPGRYPSVVIMNPTHGSKLPAGSTLNLWGSITHDEFEGMDPKAVRWIIDGKEIAKGSLSVFVVAPPEGKHSCKLQIKVDGKTIEESVSFRTISIPDSSEKIER